MNVDYTCADSMSLISAARPSSHPDRRIAPDTAADRPARDNPALHCNNRAPCRRVPLLVVLAFDRRARVYRVARRRARWTKSDSCRCNAPLPGRPGKPGSSYNIRRPRHQCYQVHDRDSNFRSKFSTCTATLALTTSVSILFLLVTTHYSTDLRADKGSCGLAHVHNELRRRRRRRRPERYQVVDKTAGQK